MLTVCTEAQFHELQKEYCKWLKKYHNRAPRDPSKERPKGPSIGTINPLLLDNNGRCEVYQWMLDEMEWFSEQFLRP